MILICNLNTLDISSFKINFFKQEEKLYYVNAMNNDNGDIYFEFWGEANKIRYFIGLDSFNEERIKFKENEIFFIETNTISTFHESLIVNNNNDINILSMNKNYFDFINIIDSKYTYKNTKDIVVENKGRAAQRNHIIKLKDGTYLLSILLYYASANYRYYRIFKFTSNEINGYKKLHKRYDMVNYSGMVSCIQTDNYIECSYSNLLSGKIDYFTVGIYDLELNKKENINLGKTEEDSFSKIIYIKGEIAAYIFFNLDKNNAPTLLIKKLTVTKKLIGYDYNLENIINNKENIIENIGYTIDIGIFSSDIIKIDSTKFVIFFTIKSTYNLLLCLFDFNENYSGIRFRKYELDFNSINVQITINLRGFLFKDYFGLLFYDSVSEFPGYLFFNYINITSYNKIDARTIMINDFENSIATFLFLENLEFINNIYNGPIKIRIENFSTKEESGILTKSSYSNSEISIGDILDINDTLIFEKVNTQLDDYFLDFLPIVQESDVISEIYGNYEENDFEQVGYFTKYVFTLNIPKERNCTDEEFIYLKNEKEKYCLISCDSYRKKQLYQDERENICYNDCSEAKNGNIYTFLYKCVLNCPNDYVPNKNNICVPNETLFDNEELEEESYEDEESDESNSSPLLDKFCQEVNVSHFLCDYPSDINTKFLEENYPNLTIIKIDECKNKLIAEHLIDNDTSIFIKQVQDIINLKNFEYELHLSNGIYINKSLCKDTKMEIYASISPDILATHKALKSQGYDMFDLSSNLYSDNCISVELNDNDVTLGTRQKDIKSAANSVCPEGCSIQPMGTSSNKASCSCDFNYEEENKEIKIEKQEVKEDFLSYIFNMINYKIITCHGIITNLDNYIYNYAFLIGAIIYIMIIILFIIYLCRGNKAIKVKYLLHEPKEDEKNRKSYIIDLSDVSKKFKLSSSRSVIMINEKKSLFNNNSKPKKKKKKIKLNPPKNKISNNSSKKNLKVNSIYIHKKSGNKKHKKIKFKIKDDKIHSKIILNMNNYNNKEETNSIEYNELTYAQAVLKDERNIWQIFFSYFNEKLDLIQIFFYPKEFDHFSLSLTLYLYELLIDFTLNAILFSDDVISQKYYNNGKLLFITSNILSIASNIFSSLFASLIEFLVNYNEVLEAAKQETNSELLFNKIFIKIYKIILCKIRIFYIFIFISGLGCIYYLLLFCAIFKRIQKNLFINYIIGTLWSFGYKILFSILSTVMRKIALLRKYRRLYIISKFINEKL